MQLENIIDSATLKNLVLLLHVVAWSISIRKRIFVLNPEQTAEPKNGITPTKSGLLLKEISITSRIISVLQDAELKMRRLYMLI